MNNGPEDGEIMGFMLRHNAHMMRPTIIAHPPMARQIFRFSFYYVHNHYVQDIISTHDTITIAFGNRF